MTPRRSVTKRKPRMLTSCAAGDGPRRAAADLSRYYHLANTIAIEGETMKGKLRKSSAGAKRQPQTNQPSAAGGAYGRIATSALRFARAGCAQLTLTRAPTD